MFVYKSDKDKHCISFKGKEERDFILYVLGMGLGELCMPIKSNLDEELWNLVNNVKNGYSFSNDID